ncbi:MAG: hypothetical protein RBR97_11110 [Bacteroidales bacterium]|nr:hypothetical protein [Bacteroidales bacterium]
MNITDIYTSKKLETIIPVSLIKTESTIKRNPFEKWNATVFFISRKKCLLVTNSITRYSLILSGLTKSDLENLSEIFINTFIDQLETEEILFNELELRVLIGKIALHKTDNDRTIIGNQNYILRYIDNWKDEFGSFENWDFRNINKRINRVPYKQLGWLFPKERMKILLEEIKASA